MPYSLGGDLLPEEKVGLKERLDPEEEEKLSRDMGELYDRLLPSAESDDRRRQLVQKLEKLFNKQWPGKDIKVHIFGSSGNKLCSSDSDGMSSPLAGHGCKNIIVDWSTVDICITTTYKELEHVCLLAEVLANRESTFYVFMRFKADMWCARWHGASDLCFSCESADRENLGPRVEAGMRHECQ
jgi:hypothetical protein